MFSVKDKEFLKKEGYLVVNLKELYPNEFERAEKVLQDEIISSKKFDTLICKPDKVNDEAKKLIDSLDVKLAEGQRDQLVGSQDDLESIHTAIVNDYDEARDGQIWMFSQVNNSLFYNFKKDAAKDLYEFTDDEVKKIEEDQICEYTLYLPGGQTPYHLDGCESGRLMVFLTYFSHDYKDGGGIFEFKDNNGDIQEIEPVYGTSLLLDFTDKEDKPTNNIDHRVTEVDNFRRYCFLSSLNSIKGTF
jgi:hypothetical protein